MAEQRGQQNYPRNSILSSFMRWLRIKNYQYEVTTSLYMLTSTEKVVFNSIFLTLISLLVVAAYLYLPAHLFVIYTRVWYYISGEFTQQGHHISFMDSIGNALKATKEVVVSQTASSVIAKETIGRASQVAEAIKDEL